MVVAHPDDESLFGGGQLSEEWFVICVTGGDNELRRNEFINAMESINAGYEIWEYKDEWGGDFCRPELIKDLQAILELKWWGKIVTHSLSGEYGHSQHIALSEIMHNIVKEDLYVFTTPRPTSEILTFNHLSKKIKLLDHYQSQYLALNDVREYIPFERIKRIR